MPTRPAAPAVIALLLAVGATLAACQRKTPPTPSVLSSAEMPSKSAVPLGSVAASDPSIPPASVVPSEPAAPTSRDDSSTRPRGDLTKAEESNSMPKAGQANNHSSPSFEPGKATAVRPANPSN